MFEQLDFFGHSTFSEPFTVSQLTSHIRRLIQDDPALDDLWVEGEISNFNRAASGHCYFTIKDAGSQIGCVMWRNVADAQRTLPKSGDQVLAHGHVDVYEAGGRYQLYVDQIRPAGVGALYLEFERLKARLEAEGLFAAERKRPLPRPPHRIGVVTSPIAAALRDILNVLSRRYPLVDVLLSPTRVQGEEAPPQIVDALTALNARSDVDVIIVARGGGSLEDLWAFNDERVARAIAHSRLPVVCGVGHETDFSLADFAADVRAPTPSAAAEIVVPDQRELRERIARASDGLSTAVDAAIQERRWALDERQGTLQRLSPRTQLTQARQRLDELMARAQSALDHEIALHRAETKGLMGRLTSVSPLATIDRGYAIVRHRTSDRVVQSVDQVASGDAIDVRVSDGEFGAEVEDSTRKNSQRGETE